MSDEVEDVHAPARSAPSIATGRGDAGITRLAGGDAVPKADARVEAYGAIDELNAAIGLARVRCPDAQICREIRTMQRELFAVGAAVSTPSQGASAGAAIDASVLARLDAFVERLEAEPGVVFDWTLPGECAESAAFDLARTICRRAERATVRYQSGGGDVEPGALAYLNRASDVLWLVARVLEARLGVDARLRDESRPGPPWSRAW